LSSSAGIANLFEPRDGHKLILHHWQLIAELRERFPFKGASGQAAMFITPTAAPTSH
jgi:hypothetical protein